MSQHRSIGNAPRSRRPRDDLAPGLRSVPFEHTAVIAYLVTDAIVITNVFELGLSFLVF
jgi:toxin ParE1/3/4